MRKTRLSRSPTRRKRRSASEFNRIYGSRERVEWVKSLPCVVPICFRRDVENMHIEGDGVGRKANYDKIVPCCHGHHAIAHWRGIETFQRMYSVDLELAAVATQQRWLAHLARMA